MLLLREENKHLSFKVNKAYFILLIVYLMSLSVQAQSLVFKQTALLDEQFLLLNVKTTKLLILEGADAYKVDDQILLPVTSILQLLEIDITVSNELGLITLVRDGDTIKIDMIKNQGDIISSDIKTPIYWSNDESQLFVSHLLIEKMIDAKINVNMSQLTAELMNPKKPFPVEQRLAREKRKKHLPKHNGKNVKGKRQKVFTEELLLDTYQFIGEPQANINLGMSANDNHENNFNAAIHSSSDLFYHYAQLVLNKSDSDTLATSLRFSRHQSSPYETLPLGVNRYSLGDVYGNSNELTSTHQSGLGMSFSRRPVNYSPAFGTISIDGIGQPGWEVELYRGGVLLQVATIPDDGNYIFTDIETTFGTNRFIIKLYGPYGEEEIEYKNITINSTQLKESEYGFNGYILDRSNKLLGGLTDDYHSFSPDTFGFSFDYGLFDNVNFGLNLTEISHSQNDDPLRFIGGNMQTSIPDALFKLNFSKQVEQGYAVQASAIGQLSKRNTYSFYYKKSNDHDSVINLSSFEEIQGTLNSRIGRFSTSNYLSYSKDNNFNKLQFLNRTSTSINQLSFTNLLNYRETDLNEGSKSNVSTGELSMAGNVFLSTRISAALRYDLKNKAKISQVNFTSSSKLNSNMHLSNQFTYQTESENNWRINSSLSWTNPNILIYSSASYNAQNAWSVGLGLKFSIGYDHHHNEWLFSSKNMATTATLDVNSFLDQNNNHILDAGDIALPGVGFGHLKEWENIKTAKNGQAILPFVNTFKPTTFSPKWVDGVSPAAKSYSVYTHPGSIIKANIPFIVKTTISGFTLFEDINKEPLAEAVMHLVNLESGAVSKATTDIDGFFEFIEIESGKYQLFIDPALLSTLALKSDAERIQFTTPRNGGYLELDVITLVPASQNVTTAIKVVQVTAENHEPIEELEAFFRDTVLKKESIDNSNKTPDSDNLPTMLKKSRTSNYLPQKNGLINSPKLAVKLTPKLAPALPLITKVSSDNNVKKWVIQFAIFKNQSFVDNFTEKLKEKNIIAFSYFNPKDNTFRVLSRPFNSRAEAKLESISLTKRGVDNFIRQQPSN